MQDKRKANAMKRKPKMRETDRLIRNIALCTLKPGEKLKDAEADVRSRVERSRLETGRSELVVARDIWHQLTHGGAHYWVNQMIANGHVRPLSYEEFDAHKACMKVFQSRARHFEKAKAKAREEGIL